MMANYITMTNYITNVNEQLMMGKVVSFPAPEGGISLLEAILLKVRGEVRSLLPMAKRRIVVVGGKTLHLYTLL